MKELIELIASLSGNGLVVLIVIAFGWGFVWLLAKLGSAVITAIWPKAPSREKSPTDSSITGSMCILHNNHLDVLIASASATKALVESLVRKCDEILVIISEKNPDRTRAIYVPADLMDELRSILHNIEKIPTDKLPANFVSDLLRRLDAVETAIKQLGN